MRTHFLSMCAILCASVLAVDPTPIPAKDSFVIVAGVVRAPGKLPWKPDMTATTAIMMCGGIGWRAPKRAYIIRGTERITIPLDAILRGKEPDVKLLPGDTLDLKPPPAPKL